MGRFIVTGAAGFIGSAVARKLLSQNNEVLTIDNLSTGFEESIPEGAEFIKGDCQDEKIIKSLKADKFDAIFHIAGQSSGEVSFDDPVYDLQTNTQSTLLLLDLAKKTGCNKFIYASSMSVYGEQPDKPVPEESVQNPQSFYAIGKLASEQYLRVYQKFGIDTVSLRLFNVYGPGQNMKNLRQGMVSIFISQAIKSKEIIVKGSLDRFRDFVYIDDVVDAFILSLEKNNNAAAVYNVGCGVKTTVGELIEKIKNLLPFEISCKCQGKTMGDLFGIYGESDKIKKEMGWKIENGLDDGLKKMIDWALNEKF